MMNFRKVNGKIEVSTKFDAESINRNDWKSFEAAEAFAAEASKDTGLTLIPTDEGQWTSPRYDVIEAPKVGAPVSYAFNGDYYPDGEIVSVTNGTYRIVKTSTGGTYYRRKKTSCWKKEGGTWSLVHGHINKRNESF